ncbi:MAG: pyrroline-5-carboxylate reductase [Desulfuromonadaceae bacterium]|nr:pyrroline-5-carboxylate reductase [Desulfuromonas sp.]MDY0185083.1 pyrroline-5-carboxylate reductase [Desulfuromonadaceae bacterium]
MPAQMHTTHEEVQNIRTGFIGGGNMAEAIIRGLIASGAAPQNIMVAEVAEARRDFLQREYGVEVSEKAASVVEKHTQVVLAVKPQGVDSALRPVAECFSAEHCLISILAGVSTARLEALIDGQVRVIRAMPNTPALIGAGAAGICRGRYATTVDEAFALQLFGAVGCVEVVSEAMLDAVTGVSGSGPAYVYMLIEAMADGGVLEGLTRDTALSLAAHTVAGAAQMVAQGQGHPALLREKVCSPAGTTVAAVHTLEQGNFRATVMDAVGAATKRARELG